jgi:hypothetical protein
MRMLLRAMGFWIWGLIAISLSVSFVTLSYRLASIYHWHHTSVISSPTETTHVTSGTVPRQSLLPDTAKPQAGAISRVIAKQMRSAHTALQAGEWNEALRNLEAAQKVSPVTPLDLKTIYEFKAYAYLRLKNLNVSTPASPSFPP